MSFLLITPVSPDQRRRQCLRLLKPGSERFNPPAEPRVFLAGVSWFVRVGKLGGEDGRVLGWIVPSLVCVFDLESRQTKHAFQCMLTRKKATLTHIWPMQKRLGVRSAAVPTSTRVLWGAIVTAELWRNRLSHYCTFVSI